jgi:hypothetical protein
VIRVLLSVRNSVRRKHVEATSSANVNDLRFDI